MEHKTFSPQFKAVGKDGTASFVVATLNTEDKDGDVTLPGFFGTQHVVMVPSHDWSHVPIGKGTVSEQGDLAVASVKFNLNIPAAKSWYEAVKFDMDNPPALQQYSYGFTTKAGGTKTGSHQGRQVRFLRPLDNGSPGAVVHEVSTVMVGAGEGTRTLSVKADAEDKANETKERPVEVDCKAAAIKSHHASITAQEWDPAGVVAGILDGTSVSDLRTVFAWVDPNEDPEAKASYRFPHHHGVDGPVNIRALVTGIAVLNGATGAKSIPDGHRQAVYDHLAGHLRDADREPPELRAPDGELKLHEEAIAALAGVGEYLESAERVVALRAEKGKALSRVNLEALGWAGEDLRRMVLKHAELERRLRDTPREAAAVEFARFLANQRRSAT